jgi:uncharacterized protein (TIGR02246 family)
LHQDGAKNNFRHLVGFAQFGGKMAVPVDSDRNPPKPTPPKQPNNAAPENDGDPLPNSAVDDFFVKMNRDFRRPKPSEEAVAAALHAIQTLAGDVGLEPDDVSESNSSGDFENRDAGEPCPKCTAVNSGSNRFCGFCGTTLLRRDKPGAQTPASALVRDTKPREQTASEQHIHHHHHHYFSESEVKHSLAGETNATLTGELAAPPLSAGAAAEAAIQKLVRDWTLCCNSKRLDDLLALYSPDAIVLRSNVPPAHGRTAIRNLLQAALQAGLGDVELQPADAGVLGDIACLTGTSRMLVPAAPGKRHEETGKFLIVARRESGDWKILADSWCIDLLPKQTAPPSAPLVGPRTPRTK